MSIVLFKEITTEEALLRLEEEGVKYKGLLVDMDDKEQRKYVKDSALHINNILKKLERARIDKPSEYKKVVNTEAALIKERLEKANSPFSVLIDNYTEKRKQIIATQKEEEAKKALKIKVDDDHEIAIIMFNDYLRERIAEEYKAEAERVQAKADQIARDKKIADDAAENARLKAEEKAADDKAQAAREIEKANQRQIASDKAAKEAAEKAVIDAEQAEQRRIQEAKDYEASQSLQIAEAEELRLKNIEMAELVKIEAEKTKQKAIEDTENRERQRVADENEAIKKAAAERESDIVNKKTINKAALEAFVNVGLSVSDGKIALNAIYKKLIPKVTIVY